MAEVLLETQFSVERVKTTAEFFEDLWCMSLNGV
jgi:hypothetical protein